MQPLDRRPFGFKGKGFICCQLCRGELVKVVHDRVLGCCIHRYLPKHTPLSDLLRLGQDHLMDFSGAALEHPVDDRGRASHAKFHSERRCVLVRQKAIKGSLGLEVSNGAKAWSGQQQRDTTQAPECITQAPQEPRSWVPTCWPEVARKGWFVKARRNTIPHLKLSCFCSFHLTRIIPDS